MRLGLRPRQPGAALGGAGPKEPCGHFAFAVFGLALFACGPMVMSAPFSSRPDTLDAGDLLGSFDGLVVDSETERPIPEATVEATWAFERGIGLVGPAGEKTIYTQTNPDGRYEIPRLVDFPEGASARVARFTLVVYRRGYVAWRSDQMFPVPGRRHDFSQRRNRVRLVQWKESWSHAKHLAFMGGGESVKKAAAWERQAAAMELLPADAQPKGEGVGPGPALLDASRLLTEEDVRALNKYTLPLTVGRLPDLPRSEFYDTLHFQSEAKSERYDVAIRLWRLGEVAAEAQYKKLLADLPELEATAEVGDASARVAAPEVRAVVFLVKEPGIVVSVTCGLGHCVSAPTVVGLSKLVQSRLGSIDQKRSLDAPLDPFATPNAAPTGEPQP